MRIWALSSRPKYAFGPIGCRSVPLKAARGSNRRTWLAHWTGDLHVAGYGALGGRAAQAPRAHAVPAGPRAGPAQLRPAQAGGEDAGDAGRVGRFPADPAHSLARGGADRPRPRGGARLRPRPGGRG